MNERTKPRARTLRFASRVWSILGLITWWLATTPEAYVAMFMIIAAIFSVGEEILNELARSDGRGE